MLHIRCHVNEIFELNSGNVISQRIFIKLFMLSIEKRYQDLKLHFFFHYGKQSLTLFIFLTRTRDADLRSLMSWAPTYTSNVDSRLGYLKDQNFRSEFLKCKIRQVASCLPFIPLDFQQIDVVFRVDVLEAVIVNTVRSCQDGLVIHYRATTTPLVAYDIDRILDDIFAFVLHSCN